MTCEFADRCWKYWYTKYYQDNGKSWGEEKTPPDRFNLLLSGYGTPEMGKTFVDRKGIVRYKGINAQSIPPGSLCPVLAGQRKDFCREYCAEKIRMAKQKAKEKEKYPNKIARTYISSEVRKMVAERDKYTCVYCGRFYQELKEFGQRMGIDKVSKIDHVLPLALGGSSEPTNLAFSCHWCNSEKGTQLWAKGCKIGRY